MRRLTRLALGAAAVLAAASAPLSAQAPASPRPLEVAMWKVADEDTTIYLFGTVHMLAAGTPWFDARIAAALAQSDTFVTEIPIETVSKENAATMRAMAALPKGTSLRGLLTAEERTRYEAALKTWGMPAAAFDGVEPWMAAMTLSLLPLIKHGYRPDAGVEDGLVERAPPGVKRAAVESFAGQMAIFDTMPLAMQKSFLMAAIDNADKAAPMMEAMVTAWQTGDVAAVDALVAEGFPDEDMADRLLYARNRAWADWVKARLDTPGTVFMAVGAGHLAGDKSVQAYLAQRGVAAARVR